MPSALAVLQTQGRNVLDNCPNCGGNLAERRCVQCGAVQPNPLSGNFETLKLPIPSEEVEAVFLALSHEARRHVILLLSQLGGELPSGYLAARFQHSWPTTTRHLHVLERAGVVVVRRDGRSSYYRLDRDRLRGVVGGWLALVEPVGPDLTWPARGPRSTAALARRSRNQKGPKR